MADARARLGVMSAGGSEPAKDGSANRWIVQESMGTIENQLPMVAAYLLRHTGVNRVRGVEYMPCAERSCRGLWVDLLVRRRA